MRRIPRAVKVTPMGLMDRLKSAKRYVWSPMQIGMVGTGSDAVALAGRQAKVVVDITGEDDETMQRIELLLRLNVNRTWPLAQLPATLGRHEVTVELPTGLPPSSEHTEYFFVAKPLRSRGTAVEVLAPVNVVSRPEDLFWPDRPRAQSDGPGVSIQLDAETVDMGASISGRVLAAAGQKLTVEVGPVLDSVYQVEGEEKQTRTITFKSAAKVELKEPGAFSLQIPGEHPPTLQNATTSVVWEVRAKADGVEATHVFGVLDPNSLGAARRRGNTIAGLLGGTPH
jgi:hypothetical protein